MTTALLLLPDFSLILFGWILHRYIIPEKLFWTGLEKLIYFVLFPALLFHSVAKTTFDLMAISQFAWVGLLATASGIGLGYLGRWIFNPGHIIFASGVQCAFRFNSYIALALAGRVGGEAGIAWMALLLGMNVPICNAVAVWILARHGKMGVWREIGRNPLIWATLLGLLASILHIHLPEFVNATLNRLGAASLAMGLMAVGAGLYLAGVTSTKGIVSYWLTVKLLAMPLIAWWVGSRLNLPALQLKMVVMFAALPTASSAYILAMRLGGYGAIVAFLISASTLLSIFTMPLWLLWLG